MNEVIRQDRINDGLSLLQNSTHLAFGTDALRLAALVSKSERGAELGAGNGIISLLLAARGRLAHVDAFEIQPTVAALCAENVKNNGLEKIVTVHNKDLRQVDDAHKNAYKAVFTNPPYMKVDAGKDCSVTEKQIARHEVAGDIYEFCRAGSSLLTFGGDFYCVYRPDRMMDLLDAMRKAQIEPKLVITVCESPAHAPSMILVKGRKGGKAGLYYAPIFFIRTEDRKEYSNDYKYLLEKGEFHERFRMP